MRTLITLALLGLLLPARDARACGGFFCNASQPVNQTGERILFTHDERGRLVTYVQVQYTGAPESFSWVVPVLGVPEVEAGTDVLFAALERLTTPRFVVESCAKPAARYLKTDHGGGFDCGGGCGNDDGYHRGGDLVVRLPPPPEILAQGDAGPYTYTVIEAGDSDVLFFWLAQNQYAVTPRGQQLLGQYLAEGYHFLAVKLQPQRTVGDVRPLVLRSDEPQPCIPLRLTAVAAQQDMPVRAWVLGPGRAVPDRWLHAEVNDARIDWESGGANYEQLVSEAVDEAGGQAFVTDFAGSTGAFSGLLWRGGAYDDLDPREPDALRGAGVPDHAVLAALQRRWSQEGTDLETARAELNAEVLEPLRRAQALLDASPYLTRLFTRVSPEEMLTDPTFTFTDEAGDIPADRVASSGASCVEGLHGGLLLPSGRIIDWMDGASGPAAAHEAGPAAVRVDRYETGGRRGMVADHTKDVPAHVEVGASGCAGCRASLRGSGLSAWAIVAAVLLAARRLRRRR